MARGVPAPRSGALDSKGRRFASRALAQRRPANERAAPPLCTNLPPLLMCRPAKSRDLLADRCFSSGSRAAGPPKRNRPDRLEADPAAAPHRRTSSSLGGAGGKRERVEVNLLRPRALCLSIFGFAGLVPRPVWWARYRRKTRGDTVHVRCTAPGPGCSSRQTHS